MNKQISLIGFLLFYCISGMPALAETQRGEELSPLLDRSIPEITVSRSKAMSAVAELASKYGVPIGVEVGSVPGNPMRDAQCTRILLRVTVRTVLNSVAQCCPEYEWSVKDGVVNISYASLTDADPFFDVVISDFAVLDGDSAEIKSEISESAEMKEFLKRNEMSIFQPHLLPSSTPAKLPAISLSLRNVSVREILNATLRTNAFRYWSVVKGGDHDQTRWILLW